MPLILVVEDDPLSRLALQILLADHGFEARAFASAEEALLTIPQLTDDHFVALIDLDLPGMSGADLIRELATSYPDARAVMITSASRERIGADVDQSIPLVRKPLDFNRLLRVIAAQ